MLVTETREKAVETIKSASKDDKENKGKYPENLAQILCIQYHITFRKKSLLVLVLFDSGNEVNAIHPIFA